MECPNCGLNTLEKLELLNETELISKPPKVKRKKITKQDRLPKINIHQKDSLKVIKPRKAAHSKFRCKNCGIVTSAKAPSRDVQLDSSDTVKFVGSIGQKINDKRNQN